MRSNIISCAIALSLALGLGGPASAQRHGPPLSGVPVTQDLVQRLQVVLSKLTGRSDAAAIQMITEGNALIARLQSTPDMSYADLTNITIRVEQLESAVG